MVRGLLIFFLLCGVGSLFAQTTEEMTVEASGMAPGRTLASWDDALNKALRGAVRQCVGTLLDQETILGNSKLLEEEIFKKMKEYLISYKIIEDNKGEGGIYRVKLEAVVGLGKLQDDIRALGILE